jgi:hypothetical protein
VREIEHARTVSNRIVFAQNARVLDGHFESAKRNEPAAKGAMLLV